LKRRTKKLSFAGKAFLFLNLVFVILLLVSYLAPFVSPEHVWPLAFLGLGFPLFLVINLIFLAIWLLFRRKYFMISLFAILLGFNQVGNLFQLNSTSKTLPEKGTNLKVLSYNVRNFDLYNYGPGWTLNFTNRNNIYNYLKQEDYDIICFQEFVYDKSGQFKTLDTLPRFLRARHSHFEYTRSSKDVNFFGLATFSAYPIVNRGKILLKTNVGNLCIYTDIKIGADTVRVYNLHFESIGLSEEDHMFIENMINIMPSGEDQTYAERGRRVMTRLKGAFAVRASQAEAVAAHIRQSPYPVILAGDFNDTPNSYVYRQINKQLNDAFRSGKGLGRTYIGAIPSFRIDYIFHSNEIKAFNYRTGNEKYSDHYPISVVLNLPFESVEPKSP
jgi:endonuclease/exonuclease/phosphatase family metal-dependent hydrolase